MISVKRNLLTWLAGLSCCSGTEAEIMLCLLPAPRAFYTLPFRHKFTYNTINLTFFVQYKYHYSNDSLIPVRFLCVSQSVASAIYFALRIAGWQFTTFTPTDSIHPLVTVLNVALVFVLQR
uniref:Putative secreted peptide n=1 Tax=Anopheles braziliensis TaxID=58242 RepID=A0A2M3ZQK5_9DIPT